MAQQKVKIQLPKGYSPKDRISIGRDIIEAIQRRATEDNKGFNPDTGRDKTFAKYSKAYAKKKGVSRSDVDLILSAEMFNDMKVLTDTSESVTIGFEAGTESNAKAEGNQKGTYGNSRPVTEPRYFLGIQKNTLDRILKNYERKGGSSANSQEDQTQG